MNIKKLLVNLRCNLANKTKATCQLAMGVKKEEGKEVKTFHLIANLYPIEFKLALTY